MKMSEVEATGSARSRAEDSEARAQVACYGALPGGRPGHQGRANIFAKKKDLISPKCSRLCVQLDRQ